MSKTHRTLTRLYLQTIPGGTTGNSTTFAGGNYTTLLPWLQSAMGAYGYCRPVWSRGSAKQDDLFK